MERLSGLDASFLYLETPSNHMHVTGIMVLDPSTMPDGYSFDKTKELVAARLHLVPQFRRRLAMVPFQLHHPVWVEDPDFDLDYHVRRIAAPTPGGQEELAEVAGEVASRQLDRSRPLWEMWIVEGLENGHIGVIAKMHHCTIDGVSGANMMVHLFDMEPEPAEQPVPEEEWSPERLPTDVELVTYALRSRVRRPWQAVQIVPKVIGAAVNVVRARRNPDIASPPTPLTAPRTSFNGSITPHRKVAFARIALDDIKAVKNAFGTTVNDVVLAVVSGALRRYLLSRGELPDKSLIACVPISVRDDEGAGPVEGSNQVSAMFTSLATQVDDPVERLHAIREVTKGAKEEHKAIGADLLMGLTEFAAPRLWALGADMYSRMRLAERHPVIHNLVVSNVPGPPFPLYFAGARLVAMSPMGPVFHGAGLNITVLSYMDSVDFGFMACRESVPGLWDVASAVSESVEELKKAAAATT
jgi:diacylglycerol O-acyltransferase / wax synthase